MKLKFQKSKELSLIESLLISNLYDILNKIDSTKEDALKYLQDGKYRDAEDKLREARYFEYQPEFIRNIQKQLFEHASIETLNKIVNQDKFKNEYSYSEDFLIDTRVLPKFSSYDNFPHDGNKSYIAKKLGATIIV